MTTFTKPKLKHNPTMRDVVPYSSVGASYDSLLVAFQHLYGTEVQNIGPLADSASYYGSEAVDRYELMLALKPESDNHDFGFDVTLLRLSAADIYALAELGRALLRGDSNWLKVSQLEAEIEKLRAEQSQQNALLFTQVPKAPEALTTDEELAFAVSLRLAAPRLLRWIVDVDDEETTFLVPTMRQQYTLTKIGGGQILVERLDKARAHATPTVVGRMTNDEWTEERVMDSLSMLAYGKYYQEIRRDAAAVKPHIAHEARQLFTLIFHNTERIRQAVRWRDEFVLEVDSDTESIVFKPVYEAATGAFLGVSLRWADDQLSSGVVYVPTFVDDDSASTFARQAVQKLYKYSEAELDERLK